MADVDDTLRRGVVFRDPSHPNEYYLVSRDGSLSDLHVWIFIAEDEEELRLVRELDVVYCPENGDFLDGFKAWHRLRICEEDPLPEDLETIYRQFEEAYASVTEK